MAYIATTFTGLEGLCARRERLKKSLYEESEVKRDAEFIAEGKENALREVRYGVQWEVLSAIDEKTKKPLHGNKEKRDTAVEIDLAKNDDHKRLTAELYEANLRKWNSQRRYKEIIADLRDVRDDIVTSGHVSAMLATGIGQEILSGQRDSDPAKWQQPASGT